ncbi:MAG: VIT1/CCC1 transporter family protein [Nitrospirae bacterium]|nr:VIT1/CCC1 transporter family protein [Nitrospirota bacterium]
MKTSEEIKRYRANMGDELNSAALYRTISQKERDPRIAEVYQRLAATEEDHAGTWAKRLRDAGAEVPDFRPSWRTKVFIWLAGRYGAAFILPSLSSLERMNANDYAKQPEAAEMVSVEHSHALLLRQIGRTVRGGLEGAALARIEGRHRAAGGNALRAAVLGASDGLLSNFNLMMGVAGAGMTGSGILLTGLAGLLAGAISMALGEWISVKSSRELYEKQIRTEQEEIAASPEEEIEELVLIYQARGLDETSARNMATQIMSNSDTAIETLARDELGIDPANLGGSAWEAAITSFLLFAVGAVVPVVPYVFAVVPAAIAASALLSLAGLFVIGAGITLFTGRSVLYSGARQVLFGLCAAAVSFLIGRLIGVSIAG